MQHQTDGTFIRFKVISAGHEVDDVSSASTFG